ncbi:MAG: DUF1800 family protein [Pyrinomonadaceae bacterium]
MTTRGCRLAAMAVGTVLLFLVSVPAVLAQIDADPDPNSPTPVLVSVEGSARALAAPATKRRARQVVLPAQPQQAFAPNSLVRIFVTNLDLLKTEGPAAFRVYAVDRDGRLYRFPVTGLEETAGQPGVYSLTIRLADEIGYWEPPKPDGDLMIYVTWRGLASNKALLGYGKTGGMEKLAGLIQPAPITATPSKAAAAGSAELGNLGYRFSGDRIRFLEQATFGPTPADDLRIRRIGIRAWLEDQFTRPFPSAGNPYPNTPLASSTNQDDVNVGCGAFLPNTNISYQICIRDRYTMYQPQTWFMREAFYGDAQLRLRVAWALSQIWVTSGVDIQQGRHMVEWFKILQNNAFGNYRTLMKEMTLSPTMGDYLDMARSTRTNPNENYAREIMQLFSVGLFMLNQNGTLQRDASGNPIPTYDQNVVNDLTKVLTGWSFCNTAGATCPNFTSGTVNFIDPMILNGGVGSVANNRHDLTAKTLLTYPGSTTTNIPACSNCTTLPNITTYANNSLEQALDNIFYHPNVGPYIGKILIQQLVTSDPTPAYVGRVAAVFNNNGQGVRGDLRAVVKAILLDPEARGDVKTDPNYGKLREPVLFATNLLRWFNVQGAAGGQSDGNLIVRGEFTGMGQRHFQSPTVFNYYPPDYVIPGTSLLGPEFALMTTGTSIQRANFVNRMVFNNIPIGNQDVPSGTALDFSELQAIAAADTTSNQLMDVLNVRMMHGTMSSSMRGTILTAVNSIASTDPMQRAKQAVYLVATSSQFQVQR